MEPIWNTGNKAILILTYISKDVFEFIIWYFVEQTGIFVLFLSNGGRNLRFYLLKTSSSIPSNLEWNRGWCSTTSFANLFMAADTPSFWKGVAGQLGVVVFCRLSLGAFGADDFWCLPEVALLRSSMTTDKSSTTRSWRKGSIMSIVFKAVIKVQGCCEIEDVQYGRAREQRYGYRFIQQWT